MKARKKRPDLTGQHTRTYANPHAYTIMMNYPPLCVSPIPRLISLSLFINVYTHNIFIIIYLSVAVKVTLLQFTKTINTLSI